LPDNPPNEYPDEKHLLSYPAAEVFAMILREIRHPTNSIDGLVRLLLEADLSEEGRDRVIRNIKERTKHIRHIMNTGWHYLETHDGIQRPYDENSPEEDVSQ
jgi:hypothetical protein